MKNNFFVVAACTVLSGGTLYASLPSAESILGWQQEEGKELIYGTGFDVQFSSLKKQKSERIF